MNKTKKEGINRKVGNKQKKKGINEKGKNRQKRKDKQKRKG